MVIRTSLLCLKQQQQPGVELRSREVQTLVGSLWRWRRRGRGGVTLWTSSCDPSATSSAVLCRRCLRFSSSIEWMVYEMACFLCFPLLCTETGTQGAFSAGFGVLQYIDKVSMSWERGCSMEACERISHIFYVFALFASKKINTNLQGKVPHE